MSKVLIIDDDPAILEVIRIVLEDVGLDVETDMTGAFFEKNNSDYPDLVLLDVLLAGQDGRDICKRIKSDKKTRHIPVILVSANSHKDVQRAAKESGANGFIAKPFDIYELVNIVQENLTQP